MPWAGGTATPERGLKWMIPAGWLVHRFESGAWVTYVGAVKARVGGEWVPASARYWNGSAWVDLT